jgi:hypothetical protein
VHNGTLTNAKIIKPPDISTVKLAKCHSLLKQNGERLRLVCTSTLVTSPNCSTKRCDLVHEFDPMRSARSDHSDWIGFKIFKLENIFPIKAGGTCRNSIVPSEKAALKHDCRSSERWNPVPFVSGLH